MKALQVFMAFMLMMIIGFFVIGFADSVPAPVVGTEAYNQSVNLSKVVSLTNSGVYATMLILAVAMVLFALLFMATAIKRRR